MTKLEEKNVRTLLKVSLDVEAANKAIKNGVLGQVIDSTIEMIKPEASYFLPEAGKRTAYFFFDLQDSSKIPPIAEPWFMKLHAEVSFIPVMNYDELGKGLQALESVKK